MTLKVTPDQVDNAKLLMALDKADGRKSEKWIVRLANAKPAAPAGPTGAARPDSAASRAATEPDD